MRAVVCTQWSVSGGLRAPLRVAGLCAMGLLTACMSPAPRPVPVSVPEPHSEAVCIEHAEVYEKADEQRTELFEREIVRLRADLFQAEQSIVTIESGLKGSLTRADAVSAVAEARIAVDRAADDAPWRSAEIQGARAKVQEADRQLQEGRIGSAIFFASRSQRVAADLIDEARRVAQADNVRFVSGRRVNLRKGPSTDQRVLSVLLRGEPVFAEREETSWILVRTPAGEVGWVHTPLLRGS